MENLTISSSPCTPEVAFLLNGKLLIEGRSLPEDVDTFFDPLEKWLSQLTTESVDFDIKLEYFNTASSKKIRNLLKTIDSNVNIKKINITWHYEKGDEDSLESGQIFEELMQRSTFRYLEFAEAA